MPSDPNGVRERLVDRDLPAREGSRRDLRPDEIAAHRFAWRLWGVSRKQVRRFSFELAAELDRARRAWTSELLECRRLQKSLQATIPAVLELRAQLTVARERLNACRAQEHALMGAAPPHGQLDEAAGRMWEEMVAAARLRAETIVRDARRAAADTLRSARAVAEIRLQAVDRRAPWGPTDEYVAGEELKHVRQTAERHLSDLITQLETLGAKLAGGVQGTHDAPQKPPER